MVFVRRRPGLVHEEVEQHRDDAADRCIDDEQREERRSRDEAADRRPDEPRHVADDPQNAESLLALLLRKDVGDHRRVRRAAHFREQSDEGGDGKQPRELVHRPERQRAECARDQSEEDQLAAAEPIGQTAADDRSNDARKRQQAQQDAGLRHPHVEFPGDVEREERKGERAADLVDEVHADDDPEPAAEIRGRDS